MPKAAPPADTAPPPRPRRALSYVDSLTPHLFVPSAERPVRAKVRQLAADTQVMPHSHPWAQVAISTTGVIRLTVDRGTYIVPPSRALWIPPGVEHAVTMVEDADLRTLYFHQPRGRCGPGVPRHQEAAWRQCRVLEVSDLLRALVRELPTAPDDGPTSTPPSTPDERTRERHLNALVLGELRRAAAVKLGVDLPHDKRLRHLCEAVLADPTRHETLSAWAQDTGASPRTVARLFRWLRAACPWGRSPPNWATAPAPSAPWCANRWGSHRGGFWGRRGEGTGAHGTAPARPLVASNFERF